MNEEEQLVPEKKSFPVWLVIIIIVILIGTLGALGWWLYKNQGQKEATTTPATTTGSDTNASIAGWQTYKSTSQGFSMAIPPDWKQTEAGTESRVSFSSSNAPEGDAPPTYPVTFANIWYETNSSNSTLQSVIDELKDMIQKSPIKDYKLESETDIDINGTAGKKIVMSYTDLQTQLSHVSGFACAIKNNKIWEINFIASAQSAAAAKTAWDQNSYLFDKMISAFIFL